MNEKEFYKSIRKINKELNELNKKIEKDRENFREFYRKRGIDLENYQLKKQLK